MAIAPYKSIVTEPNTNIANFHRYYYKSQVLLPVFGRRLVYKFGPNATGWRPQHDHPKVTTGYCG